MSITREIFERQCKRRYGAANPERMREEYYEWMVRRGDGPFRVRDELGLGPNGRSPAGKFMYSGPDWCFERFGMSRTVMADGRIICIAGEHEDIHNPDFCIYNDVIVLRPAEGETGVSAESGGVEIYGYPETVFPPTDFHAATLVGDRIVVIGRLGYMGQRRPGTTPVYALDTRSYRIEAVPTTGPAPGWIYKHHASYDADADAITVRGGKIDVIGAAKETPHLAAYRLHLGDGRWELIAAREPRRRFQIDFVDDDGEMLEEPTARAFIPKRVPHIVLTPQEYLGMGVYGLEVMSVRVTFSTQYEGVRMVVEGELPRELTETLLEDVLESLRENTGCGWTAREVESWEDE